MLTLFTECSGKDFAAETDLLSPKTGWFVHAGMFMVAVPESPPAAKRHRALKSRERHTRQGYRPPVVAAAFHQIFPSFKNAFVNH
jgi:hypothetical protein